VLVKLKKDGTSQLAWDVPGAQRQNKDIVPIVTGFIQNNNYVGRPVDVLQLKKDGSLLISDDFNGAVYRLSYSGNQTAAAD
jgi:glucose/arabinose dehydrogenase